MIVTTVVAAVFRDVDHALVATIESRIENPSLRFASALDPNAPQSLIPSRLGRALDRVKAPRWNLFAQIPLCLLHADERNAVAELESLHIGSGNGQPIPVSELFKLESNRRAEFPVNISLHVAEALFAADHRAFLRFEGARHAVGHDDRSLAVREGKAEIAAALGCGKFGLNQ